MRGTDAHNSQEPLRRAGASGPEGAVGRSPSDVRAAQPSGTCSYGARTAGLGPRPLPLGCGNPLHLGVCEIRAVCVWCVCVVSVCVVHAVCVVCGLCGVCVCCGGVYEWCAVCAVCVMRVGLCGVYMVCGGYGLCVVYV